MKEIFKVGDDVIFSKRIIKSKEYVDLDKTEGETEIRIAYEVEDLREQRTGKICGIRYIKKEQTIERHDIYDSLEYFDECTTTTMMKIYLVATDLRGFHKVCPEHITHAERGINEPL